MKKIVWLAMSLALLTACALGISNPTTPVPNVPALSTQAASTQTPAWASLNLTGRIVFTQA